MTKTGGDAARRTIGRLDRITEIPTLPEVLVRVWDLTNQEDASARDLGRAMSEDPGLTGAVLRLANSAYFGFPRKVSTVTQAIVVLGFETVKSLAMGASVFRAIDPKRGHGLDASEFFRHSLATAMGARILLEYRAPQRAGTAFSAGILHDLGKLVAAEFLEDGFRELRKRLGEGEPLEDAERSVFGLTHAEIGEWFATRWNFPDELTAAVRWHHRPGGAPEHRDYVAAVHLGDALAYRVGSPGSLRSDLPAVDPATLETLALAEGDLDVVTERVREAISASPGAEQALGV